MTRRILLILLVLSLFALPVFAGGQQEAPAAGDTAAVEKTPMDPRLFTT